MVVTILIFKTVSYFIHIIIETESKAYNNIYALSYMYV